MKMKMKMKMKTHSVKMKNEREAWKVKMKDISEPITLYYELMTIENYKWKEIYY